MKTKQDANSLVRQTTSARANRAKEILCSIMSEEEAFDFLEAFQAKMSEKGYDASPMVERLPAAAKLRLIVDNGHAKPGTTPMSARRGFGGSHETR